MAKRVYTFGKGINEGRADMKNLLGGKGANLAEMSNLGIPVPSGFTITADVCVEFYKNNKQLPAGLDKEVVVLGVSSRVEVWGREQWDKYNSNAVQTYEEIAEKIDLDLGI